MAFKYDAVLFDFDGTIADTGVGIFNSIRFAVAAMGFEPLTDSSLRSFIGPPVFDSFKRELGMTDEQSKKAVEKYRECYIRSGIYQLEVYDGIESLIKELKDKGFKVGIASSKPEKFVRKLVDFLKFNELIDFISAPEGDDAHQGKAVLITNSAKAFGVKKERVIMVGDRLFDINGANEAGVESIGVTFGYGSEKELRDSGATYIANSADDIRKIIFS